MRNGVPIISLVLCFALACSGDDAPGASDGSSGSSSGSSSAGGGSAGEGAASAAGAQAADERWSSTSASPAGNPGYAGTLTLDEYDWGALGGRLGVIQIDLATGSKRRFLDGELPSRHSSGQTSFLQPCGTGVNRVALADARGIARPITPCSSELPQPGDSRTYYGISRLSPDAERIAVEVAYDVYFDGTYFQTAVYALDGTRLAEFDGLFAPVWAPDGRLLMAGEGLYLVDAALSTPERIDAGTLSGPVTNPAVHPDGTRLSFEYNQGIWQMNLDGSELVELVYGPARLRYPTYSPDGSSVVYLSLPVEDYYDRALYFTDLDRMLSYSFDLRGLVGETEAVTIVPNGPLSWTAEDGSM
jgi:hypothetical protein